LQGLPDWFDFVGQTNAMSYKQLGNGVNVGVVYNVLKAQVLRDIDLLSHKPELVRAILESPDNPDARLNHYQSVHRGVLQESLFEHEDIRALKLVPKKKPKSA
jgi:DNA (cytosine-5)-methyltransferase 1